MGDKDNEPGPAALIAEILDLFELDARKHAGVRRQVRDLRDVLAADYEGSIEQAWREASLPLREMEGQVVSLLPEFNREPLGFAETLDRISDRKRPSHAVVKMSPRGRPGHPLRGFYHRQRGATALIWLNLQHVETAIAASFAHELGHWLWDEMTAAGTAAPLPFYNGAFADHLADPRELFADCFTTVAAYPRDLARQLFSRRGWPRQMSGLRRREQATVAEVYAHLQRRYGADLGPKSGLPAPRRFHYIVSMIHFAKIRGALLHIMGV